MAAAATIASMSCARTAHRERIDVITLSQLIDAVC
jgi:hypothetical protein